MTYNPGQVSNIFPFVSRPPDWMIIGGPADGNEAQCAVEKWPSLSIIGIEPSPAMYNWQINNEWPKYAPLVPHALSSSCGTAILKLNSQDFRCSSLLDEKAGSPVTVETVTIDSLDKLYGPFHNAILWLDIEGFELQAMIGAKKLFERREVILVNLEILERRVENTKAIERFFEDVEFDLLHKWNKHLNSHHDRIYVPRRMK